MTAPRTMSPDPSPTGPAREFLSSREFTAWLAEARVSLALTTYQAGKLVLLGLSAEGTLSVFNRTLSR